jgi:hypothetical protein
MLCYFYGRNKYGILWLANSDLVVLHSSHFSIPYNKGDVTRDEMEKSDSILFGVDTWEFGFLLVSTLQCRFFQCIYDPGAYPGDTVGLCLFYGQMVDWNFRSE